MYEELLVLIPSHSLEDFPQELGEDDAASLLNAFAVLWHPALLNSAKLLPSWMRADSPPEGERKRLVVVPRSCESWIPGGWSERVTQAGSVVVRNQVARGAMLEAALAPLQAPATDEDLVADFLALGFCHIQMEMLQRKMRHYSSIDETRLSSETLAAAEAAVSGDTEAAKARLQACFDVLTEARERFYPVDCFLIDICLVTPAQADEALRQTILTLKPLNVLASVKDLETIGKEQPETMRLVREGNDRGSLDLLTGAWDDAPLPAMPLGSILWQFERGRAGLKGLLRKPARVFAQRRFGLFPLLPQILKKSGYVGALHVVLDDGLYPDEEQSRLRWEGSDGSVVESASRIPLAADSATSYLRLPDRLSESMDNDQTAGLFFARWPETKSPFFGDLLRMSRYAPALGRFTTLTDYFERTDNPGRMSSFRPHEYFTPFVVQSVAREERDPVSRYTAKHRRRQSFETTQWLAGLARTLVGKSPERNSVLEESLETLSDVPNAEMDAPVDESLASARVEAAQRLAAVILHGAPAQTGYLLVNPCAFKRIVSVDIPEGGLIPQPAGEGARLQWTPNRKTLSIEIPGCGYVWVPSGTTVPRPPSRKSEPPLAETDLLRNEFFEVRMHSQTGGIAQVRCYDRNNRISQQLTYRFPRERTWKTAEGDEIRSQYSEMRRRSSRVLSAGPAVGEIETTGDIVDQQTGETLSAFRQVTRVTRGRRTIDVEVELTPVKMPDGEPWHNYYAARFAWNDETASLTRSVLLGAHNVKEDRIDAPHYFEIAGATERTSLLTQGLPFHRKTGPRMLDTILITQRETARKFQFSITIDQDYPLAAAFDATIEPVVVPTTSGPPRSGPSGWFLHVAPRNVQLLEILPLLAEPPRAADDWEQPAAPETPTGNGLCVRLAETEGRPCRASLRCYATPRSARQRNLLGGTIIDLRIDGDSVLVDLTAYEIADVEVLF